MLAALTLLPLANLRRKLEAASGAVTVWGGRALGVQKAREDRIAFLGVGLLHVFCQTPYNLREVVLPCLTPFFTLL